MAYIYTYIAHQCSAYSLCIYTHHIRVRGRERPLLPQLQIFSLLLFLLLFLFLFLFFFRRRIAPQSSKSKFTCCLDAKPLFFHCRFTRRFSTSSRMMYCKTTVGCRDMSIREIYNTLNKTKNNGFQDEKHRFSGKNLPGN